MRRGTVTSEKTGAIGTNGTMHGSIPPLDGNCVEVAQPPQKILI